MRPTPPVTPPHVSINRVRIEVLPGVAMDETVRGRSAFELLSTRALAELAWQQAEALRLPPALRARTRAAGAGLPRYVDAALGGEDPGPRRAAQSITRRLGRNLGHILLALHRGDEANRALRPDWDDKEWERWAGIRRVWLGGGLMSGDLGAAIAAQARAFLAGAGAATAPQPALSPWRGHMPLLGAARYLLAENGDALLFDFGHSRAKRARARLQEGAITGLHLFEPLPVDMPWLETFPSHNAESGREVLAFIAAVVARTRRECEAQGGALLPDLMLVVAAYVREGRFLGNGLYANLNQLAADARPLLETALRTSSGHPVRVHPLHDGTAAAAVHAGEARTAVLLVGTALGVGFPPSSSAGLLRLPALEQTPSRPGSLF